MGEPFLIDLMNTEYEFEWTPAVDFYVILANGRVMWIRSAQCHSEQIPATVLKATNLELFTSAVNVFVETAKVGKVVEGGGWPWVWESSKGSDFAYFFSEARGRVLCAKFGETIFDPNEDPEAARPFEEKIDWPEYRIDSETNADHETAVQIAQTYNGQNWRVGIPQGIPHVESIDWESRSALLELITKPGCCIPDSFVDTYLVAKGGRQLAETYRERGHVRALQALSPDTTVTSSAVALVLGQRLSIPELFALQEAVSQIINLIDINDIANAINTSA